MKSTSFAVSRNHIFKKSTNTLLSRFKTNYTKGTRLPTETNIAESISISRSTVHGILSYLIHIGVVNNQGRKFYLQRKPASKDFFTIDENEKSQSDRAEAFIINRLISGQLSPGHSFSERELSTASNCTLIPIREALLKISHSGLIEKKPRHALEGHYYF